MGGVGWRVGSKVRRWGWNCLRGFSSAAIPSQLESVGFIGLGNMGSHMARNLMMAGYKVTVHDINENAMKKFSDDGFPTKHTPLEVSESSDVIITMLPSSAHVLDVYNGRNGLLGNGGRLGPWLYIDSSTVDPQTSRKISMDISRCNLKEKKGYTEKPTMLDAPVSGGVPAAESGTLTFMVGGLEEAYLAAKPLLLSMGGKAIYCGGSGNGSAAKICNNMAMAISMLGASEAFALGQNLGIKASILTNIFNCSSARCWSSDTYNPVPGVMMGVPSSRNYDGGFTSKLMLQKYSKLELQEQTEEQTEEALPWDRRRRGSGGEAKVMPKMGCQENKEASGGSGAARGALWRRGEGTRRPAVEVTKCDGARVVLGAN